MQHACNSPRAVTAVMSSPVTAAATAARQIRRVRDIYAMGGALSLPEAMQRAGCATHGFAHAHINQECIGLFGCHLRLAEAHVGFAPVIRMLDDLVERMDRSNR